jgi:hypothetical protein
MDRLREHMNALGRAFKTSAGNAKKRSTSTRGTVNVSGRTNVAAAGNSGERGFRETSSSQHVVISQTGGQTVASHESSTSATRTDDERRSEPT